MKIFVFDAKVLLLFDMSKFFDKKMLIFLIFTRFCPLMWLQLLPKHALGRYLQSFDLYARK